MRIHQFLLLPVLLAGISACHSSGGAAPATTTTTAAGGSDFCALAREHGAANLAALDGDETTPEQFRQVLANLDALVAAAPPDLHDNLATVDRFEHDMFDADGNVKAGTGRPDPRLQAALRHVADYLDQQCGIRP